MDSHALALLNLDTLDDLAEAMDLLEHDDRTMPDMVEAARDMSRAVRRLLDSALDAVIRGGGGSDPSNIRGAH